MQNNYPGGCKTQKYVNLSSFSDVDALNSSFWNFGIENSTFQNYSHPRIHSISYSQEDELFVGWMLLDWSMKTDWPVCHCDIAWHVTPVACIDCDWSILILWIGDHALICSVYWKKACWVLLETDCSSQYKQLKQF